MNYSFEYKVDHFLNDVDGYLLYLSKFDYDFKVDYCLNVYLSPYGGGGVNYRELLSTFEFRVEKYNPIEIYNFSYIEVNNILSKFYEIDKGYILDIQEGLIYYDNIYFTITKK